MDVIQVKDAEPCDLDGAGGPFCWIWEGVAEDGTFVIQAVRGNLYLNVAGVDTPKMRGDCRMIMREKLKAWGN